MSRVQWLGAETVEMAPGGGEVHELVPGGLPANAAEVECLADCAKKHKSIENFDLNAYNACVMACTGQPTGPTKKLPDKPKEGADLPKEAVKTCPAGQILVNGACVPAMTPPAPEKKTPWGWILLGGAALIGGAFVLLRGAGELGGAMAENPRGGQVIQSRRWRRKDGATASIYGALPWTGAPGNRKEDWTMETVGWTIQWDDGTVGIGRVPFKTQAEAQAWLDKEHARLAEARARLTR